MKMNKTAQRFIAVDWSGRLEKAGQKRHIWIADWSNGQLSLTNGRTRDQTLEYLIRVSGETESVIVGLDFAFSYPSWFIAKQDAARASDFWISVERYGEDWLANCDPPFWGRTGRGKPKDHDEPDWKGFRKTEQELKQKGIAPKSAFQINGGGSVGTGSLRGIACVAKLQSAGFSIWPFDPAKAKMVIEIYPRLFTNKTVTSKCSGRLAHLAKPQYRLIPSDVRIKALDSEDAFDALCSVIGMKDHAAEFASLQQATDPVERLEGKIWRPADVP